MAEIAQFQRNWSSTGVCSSLDGLTEGIQDSGCSCVPHPPPQEAGSRQGPPPLCFSGKQAEEALVMLSTWSLSGLFCQWWDTVRTWATMNWWVLNYKSRFPGQWCQDLLAWVYFTNTGQQMCECPSGAHQEWSWCTFNPPLLLAMMGRGTRREDQQVHKVCLLNP